MLFIYLPGPCFRIPIFQLFGFTYTTPWVILTRGNEIHYFLN